MASQPTVGGEIPDLMVRAYENPSVSLNKAGYETPLFG